MAKVHKIMFQWAEQLKQDIREHLKYNGRHVPKKEIYLYWDEGTKICVVGKRGGFEYRIPRRDMDGAIINKEKKLGRDLTHEEIYQLAKIESQYIEYEEVNNLPSAVPNYPIDLSGYAAS
jgi:hypothetical protein